MPGPILITCATGRQGGATIRALLKLSKPPSTILAVTRDPSSPSSQKLASLSTAIKLVPGNLDDVPGIFEAAQKVAGQPIWGVLSVQLPQGMGTNNEVAQGKAMIDESITRGVKHFVYNSVDRGGEARSWVNPTPIPHFHSKHDIELYLKDKATGSDMTWTILRPTAFMDNFEPGLQPRAFLAALKITLTTSQKLQFIAAKDIGIFGARAFERPAEFQGRAISLAGDAVTVEELGEAFKAATGQALTPTFSIFGYALKLAVLELRRMIDWFADEGYGADITALKKMHPEILDLKTWVAEESKFSKRS